VATATNIRTRTGIASIQRMQTQQEFSYINITTHVLMAGMIIWAILGLIYIVVANKIAKSKKIKTLALAIETVPVDNSKST
jgi:hypothetical protein